MDKKLIDITFPIHEGMPTYNAYWHTKVKISKIGCHETEGRETKKIIIGTHTGTHMDAPLHFVKKGGTVEDMPMDSCVGPAVLISFCNMKKKEITASDLINKLSSVKTIERLLVRFDWSKNWKKAVYYKDYPYFSMDACRWLFDKGVKLLGMDTPSPDNPKDNRLSGNDSPNHKFLLSKKIILIEYLCNLNKLRGPHIFLIAAPLKLRGADGSPARVLAYNLESKRINNAKTR